MGVIAKYPRTAVVVAAALGLLGGVWATSWFGGRFLTNSISTSAQAHLTWDALALEKIVHGDSAASAKLLNENIDIELLTIEKSRESGVPVLPGMDRTLRRISELRSETHYEYTNAEFKEPVERLLQSAGGKEK